MKICLHFLKEGVELQLSLNDFNTTPREKAKQINILIRDYRSELPNQKQENEETVARGFPQEEILPPNPPQQNSIYPQIP